MRQLKEVGLTMEEIEAVRLVDLKDMEQTEAAKKMKTSQSTLQRILVSARKKMADAVINGKAISINKN